MKRPIKSLFPALAALALSALLGACGKAPRPEVWSTLDGRTQVSSAELAVRAARLRPGK